MKNFFKSLYSWLRRRKQKKFTLLISGIDNAGKTTLLAALKNSNETVAPTVGFSNESLNIGKAKVTVYDLGGGTTFRGIWEHYYAEVHGTVFVVDSTDKNRLGTAKDTLHVMFQDARMAGKPVLILLNKAEGQSAISVEEAEQLLELRKLNATWHLKTCTALRTPGEPLHKNIEAGFEWLKDSIVAEYKTLSARITKQMKEDAEREQKQREENKKEVLKSEQQPTVSDSTPIKEPTPSTPKQKNSATVHTTVDTTDTANNLSKVVMSEQEDTPQPAVDFQPLNTPRET